MSLYSGSFQSAGVYPAVCVCGDPEAGHESGVYCRPTAGMCPCGSGWTKAACCEVNP